MARWRCDGPSRVLLRYCIQTFEPFEVQKPLNDGCDCETRLLLFHTPDDTGACPVSGYRGLVKYHVQSYTNFIPRLETKNPWCFTLQTVRGNVSKSYSTSGKEGPIWPVQHRLYSLWIAYIFSTLFHGVKVGALLRATVGISMIDEFDSNKSYRNGRISISWPV